MAFIEFDSEASSGQTAIVVSFDLCGFSDFCNRADAHKSIPLLISRLFDEINGYYATNVLEAFDHFWRFKVTSENADKLREPDFVKYTGDGAIVIWRVPKEAKARSEFCTALVYAMKFLQGHLEDKLPEWEREWNVQGLPRKVRFGIALGLVYPLKRKPILPTDDETIDYVGYCINLAVRLQDHCPEFQFVVHENLYPKIQAMVPLRAIGMKGTREERVLVFLDDFEMTSQLRWQTKFERVAECINLS